MFTPIFKRLEVFHPYNIPIQPIIISPPEEPHPGKTKEILSDEEHPQNDTSSTSGGDIEKPVTEKIIFKCFLNKKRRN